MAIRESVVKQTKLSFAQIKRVFESENSDFLWIYDNFYLIGKQYGALIKSKKLLRGKSIMRGYESIKLFLSQNEYILGIESLLAHLSDAGTKHIYTSREIYAIPLLISAACINLIGDACSLPASEPEKAFLIPNAVNSLRTLTDLDCEELFEYGWMPEKILCHYENGYKESTDATKNSYRKAISAYCKSKGISELDGVKQITEEASKLGVTGGSLLFEKSKAQPFLYFFTSAGIWLSALAALWAFTGPVALICFSPLYEASLGIADFLFSFFSVPLTVPRIDLKKVPDDSKVLCVITSLLTDTKSDDRLYENLERFHLLNRDKNIYFGILADLPDTSDKNRTDSDDEIYRKASERIEILNTKYGKKFCLYARKRVLNEKDNIYGGRERKRGAVTELVRYIKTGVAVDGIIYFGEFLRDIKYVFTLDSDTNLSLDSVREILGTALHPCNKPIVKDGIVAEGYGIYQPLMRTELSSAYRTRFSRMVSGVGGADVYETASFDRFQSVFGSGVFCGTGLFSVDLFYDLVCPKMPDGKVLSHDIIEGAFLRTCFLSDISLTDSTPRNTVSFSSRLHRWIRGDVQNVRFLREKSLDLKSKYTIWNNIRRHFASVLALISILTAALVVESEVAAIALTLASLAYIIIPFVMSCLRIIACGSALTLRRFFTLASSDAVQALTRTLYEVCASAHMAFTAVDAGIRAVWRMAFSKKKMLEWVTASDSDKTDKSTMSYYIRKCFPSALLGVFIFFFSETIFLSLFGLAYFFFPVLAWSLSMPLESDSGSEVKHTLSEQDKEFLLAHSKSMWAFYSDTVTKKTGFLPPDNIQLSPTEATAYRSSPTNIGFYLVSTLAACDMGIISADEMIWRLEKSLDAVQKLDKYEGNLYNWYDLKELSVIGGSYVSAVDSGNFVTMLIALKQGLFGYMDGERNKAILHLVEITDMLIRQTNLSVFYNPRKELFVIGIDGKSGTKDNSFYDLFMSESRLTSFYAIASGEVPKKHWRSLSRTIVSSGGYVGLASWSGTMFEYMMPHLFMPIYKNSFTHESLIFTVSEQKKIGRERIWGISESAFYSFDSDMNYQYKAHGVQKLALKRYEGRELVFSPYSAFLSLCIQPRASIRVLKAYAERGMYGKYGLYEALDMTPLRSGGSGVCVKSYMAHHIGMSIIACANACMDNIFVKRFMSERLNDAASELLQEKIPADTIIFEDETLRGRNDMKLPSGRANITVGNPDLTNPDMSLSGSGELCFVGSSSGHVLMRKGKYLLSDTVFDKYSLRHSLKVMFKEKGAPATFGCAPLYGKGVYSFEKGAGSFSHISSSESFTGRVRYTADERNDIFLIETTADSKKKYASALSFEPCLDADNNYYSHLSFSKLFIQSEYDESEKIILYSRRPREESDKHLWLAVALLSKDISFTFTTTKDGFSAYRLEDEATENTHFHIPLLGRTGACINPICMIETEPLIGGKNCFLVACGRSKREVTGIITKYRTKKAVIREDIKTLPETEQLLGAVYFPQKLRTVASFSGKNVSYLWKRGISGDYPIICICTSGAGSALAVSYLSAFLALARAGIRTELIFLLEEKDKYNRDGEKNLRKLIIKMGVSEFIGKNGGIFIIEKNSDPLFSDFLVRISAFCYTSSGNIKLRNHAKALSHMKKIDILPPEQRIDEEGKLFEVFGGFFTDKGFTADKSYQLKMPFSYVLAGRNAGSVVTDSSLGYTFFRNSRQKRVTPFAGDPYTLPDGERVFLRLDGRLYDLAAVSIKTEYENGFAIFSGSINDIAYTMTVFVCEKNPLKLIKVFGAFPFEARLVLVVKPLMGSGPYSSSRIQLTRGEGSSFCYYFKDETNADFADGVGFCGCAGIAELTTDYTYAIGMSSQNIPEAGEVCAVITVGGEALFYVGSARSEKAAESIVSSIGPDFLLEQTLKCETFAASLVPPITMNTKSTSLSLLYNSFLPYQAAACRFYARGSFYQTSGAYGFRDQLQDCLCLVYSDQKAVRTHIMRACMHQYVEGDVQHWWHPEWINNVNRGIRTKCTDDFLWLPVTTADYVTKTGDYSILDEELFYISSPPLGATAERYETPMKTDFRESVYRHCLRALSNAERFGPNGLSLIGSCDWNDAFSSIGTEGRGESIFTSFFYILAIRAFLPIMEHFGDNAAAEHYRTVSGTLLENIENKAFRTDRYIRAIHDNGTVIGSEESEECKIDILSQCFAALVKGSDARVDIALDTAFERLYDSKNKILKLFDPPFTNGKLNVGYIRGYVAGIRENGGQYTHAAIWAAIAYIVTGKKDKGLEILNAVNPASRCVDHEMAKKYRTEPYVLCADIYSNPNHAGRGGWSWYTGAAAWYCKAMTEYVMGIKLTENFSVIDVKPCIEYTAKIKYNNYELTLVSKNDLSAPLLDGNPTALPLRIPDGEHILEVPGV